MEPKHVSKVLPEVMAEILAKMQIETGAIRCDCVGHERYTSFRDIRSYGRLWDE